MGGSFGPNCLIIFKSSHQDLFNEATLMAQLSSFAARTHVGFAWKFVWLSRFQRDNLRAIIELVYTLDTANHMACHMVKPSLHYRVIAVLVLGRSLCEVALQTFY